MGGSCAAATRYCGLHHLPWFSFDVIALHPRFQSDSVRRKE